MEWRGVASIEDFIRKFQVKNLFQKVVLIKVLKDISCEVMTKLQSIGLR